MTDITKLAQREKFEAWWEREYKHLESSKYTDSVPHIKYGFWMAYQAGGAELVEALEKAQQHIARQEQILLNQDESLSIRRGELEAAQTKAVEQGRTACELFDEVTTLRQGIADLEAELEREREKSRRVMSRTVKLPDDVLDALQKVARIRLDQNDFDGDCRGIADCLGDAEEALIEVVNRRAAMLAAAPQEVK
ncbi:TPA: hypothetical protein R4X16_000554 [Klebsiella variicola subsp. variicola]|uniref:hypothetical protein n=1 Tax=Klebsiella TaxID=570 RepID=UPI00166010DE|nr:hypothetical protein [Klebsiella variicola]MBD0721443.1 hypothetical protein [Klebsiella variicola]HED1709638.1 hypothetical protein [Klebsiella variicola subsp. variicola]